MNDKNPQACALAFRKCTGKLAKIKELEITSTMDADSAEALIESLAQAKCDADESLNFNEQAKNQRWYVEQLIEFSGLSAQKQFDQEYHDSFADTASENEMVEALAKMAA